MTEIPRIVSVDDHVVEPPNVWVDRLPAKYADVGPRVVRRPAKEISFVGGKFTAIIGDEGDDGPIADWWLYEDLVRPLVRVDSAVGVDRDDVTMRGVTYEEMRAGSYRVDDRLADMDANWTEVQAMYPTFPRFCGQTFKEAKDPDLALLCVRAYNDWLIEEWCGAAPDRLVPLVIIPLWDAELAAAEIRRTASKGARNVCFSEIPPYLGLPSVHTDHWDPFFQACEECNFAIHMHLGSSSKMPSTSADAPALVGSTLTFVNSALSMIDWIMSGVFVRFPGLEVSYAEGQIGWIPYVMDRADKVWEENRGWGGVADKVLEPPSHLFRKHVYPVFFDDPHGLRMLDVIGDDKVCYESDYPHSDSTWPNTRKVAETQMAHLSDEVITKIVRTNGRRLLRLDGD
jgi:predicted TIM-barrel fold metal-dependent hydrolase